VLAVLFFRQRRSTTMIRTSALRHLAWLCTAPPPWQFPDAFVPADWLPEDWHARLQHWDAAPQEAPAFVHALPNPRLGLYFETLYDALLTHLLGWQVLARNLPIRTGGLTLGELDFVVRNPHTGQVEHHEIAVKFYLGYQAQPHGPARWLGPNPADSLEGKAHRLQDEQQRRSQLPEAQVALVDLLVGAGLVEAGLVGAGLPANLVRLQASSHMPANADRLQASSHINNLPLHTRLFMPGYLFQPQDGSAIALPPQVPATHARGTWLRLDKALREERTGWVPLVKPHWLGPWQQAHTPDPTAVLDALEQIALSATPRLFARVEWDAGEQMWRETARFFVVPEAWPGHGGVVGAG
jgi:uncharacterized protein